MRRLLFCVIKSTLLVAALFSLQNTLADNLSISNDPYGYSGAYTDGESNLQYLDARYYNVALNRFASRDSYDLLNRYAYGDGNPIGNEDPSGHISALAKGLVISIGAGTAAAIILAAITAVTLEGAAFDALTVDKDASIAEGASTRTTAANSMDSSPRYGYISDDDEEPVEDSRLTPHQKFEAFAKSDKGKEWMAPAVQKNGDLDTLDAAIRDNQAYLQNPEKYTQARMNDVESSITNNAKSLNLNEEEITSMRAGLQKDVRSYTQGIENIKFTYQWRVNQFCRTIGFDKPTNILDIDPHDAASGRLNQEFLEKFSAWYDRTYSAVAQ